MAFLLGYARLLKEYPKYVRFWRLTFINYFLRNITYMPNTTLTALADIPSGYRGSEKTAEMVRKQIEERFGSEAADEYNPALNARTYKNWLKIGYRVKPGEKALKSVTVIEKKDAQGNIIKKYPKKVALFFHCQVEPITNS